MYIIHFFILLFHNCCLVFTYFDKVKNAFPYHSSLRKWKTFSYHYFLQMYFIFFFSKVEDVSEGEGKEEKVMQASARPWSSDSHATGQPRRSTSPGRRTSYKPSQKISTMVRDRDHRDAREPRDRGPLVLKR